MNVFAYYEYYMKWENIFKLDLKYNFCELWFRLSEVGKFKGTLK